MTFPTIPTAGAGKVITNVQADTSATRTSPNLNTLTSPSGELIVAIVVVYNGTSAAANFSGWTNGFTELAAGGDSGSNGGVSFGIASKWSGGSETGTISVTQAGTITGHAAWIILSIGGAHDSTPPEAGGYNAVAGAASNAIADAGSFNPAGWDVEDTLWVAVHGAGETSTTGSWTSVSAAPSGFGDYAETGQSADAVGGVEGAVAFRAEAVAAQDPGTFTGDTSLSRSAALVVAVRPAPVTAVTLSDAATAADTAATAATVPLGEGATAADTPLISAGLVLAEAASAAEHLCHDGGPDGAPDCLLDADNLTGPLTFLWDDPEAADTDWLTAVDPAEATDLRVSFPTPDDPPNAGGPTEFQTWVRKAGAGPDPEVSVQLWEDHRYVKTLTTVTVTSSSGQLVTATLTPADLTDSSGAGVELRLRTLRPGDDGLYHDDYDSY